jgi:hypothetical protein
VFASDQLDPASITGAHTTSTSELYLQLNNNLAKRIIAGASACPDRTTSLLGGDCSIACLVGSYVEPNTGICSACTHTTCGIGQLDVPCAPNADQHCTSCDAPPLYQVSPQRA